ncbi:MAG: cytochrome c [Acetobacteraceae bacterium]
MPMTAYFPILRAMRFLAFALTGAILAGAILAGAGAAAAQTPDVGVPAAGRRIAETWCSNCHVVTAESRSMTDLAPSFASIAQMPSLTPMSIRVFLQTPHTRMPDLHLSTDEIDNLIAYIYSLRRPRSGN